MKTKTINLYEFKELPEELRQKVLEKYWDINVDHDWWDSIYWNAEELGVKITGFDIDRPNYCNIDLQDSCYSISKNIISTYNPESDLYKLADSFLTDYDKAREDFPSDQDDFEDSEQYKDLIKEFENSLSEEFLSFLKSSYEYLTSEVAIKETLEANEYTFNESGEIDS